MMQMAAAMNIYNALQRWRGASGKQVHSLTDNERRILRSLKDMGILFN